MYIYSPIESVNEQSVYLLNPVKNRILKNSYFIKLLFSNENLTINGIYIDIVIVDSKIETTFNKHRCYFSIEKNINIIEKCKSIENMILKKYKTKKTKTYVISNQLTKGFIMLSNCYPICKNNFILKISGIWETETEYGLSFKFININRQL